MALVGLSVPRPVPVLAHWSGIFLKFILVIICDGNDFS